jgi:hypothetical protein
MQSVTLLFRRHAERRDAANDARFDELFRFPTGRYFRYAADLPAWAGRPSSKSVSSGMCLAGIGAVLMLPTPVAKDTVARSGSIPTIR